MRKLLELRTGYVHADGDEVSGGDSYTLCGLDTERIFPKGKHPKQAEIDDDLCPAMRKTTKRITCPACLSIAKFVLQNAMVFKAALAAER